MNFENQSPFGKVMDKSRAPSEHWIAELHKCMYSPHWWKFAITTVVPCCVSATSSTHPYINSLGKPTHTTRTQMHTHTHNHFKALWILSGTTWVSRYQKKHSPTHTYRGHQLSLVCFIRQFTCLTIFFHNFSPSFLRSTSWLCTLHFILHIFLHSIIVFFLRHMPIPSKPVLL